MRYRALLFYGGIFLVLLLGVSLFLWVTFRPKSAAPLVPVPAQQVDLSLSQHSGGVAETNTASPPAKRVPGCSLSLSFTPNTKTVAAGAQISYALTLVNNGLAACTNASISAYYADNETFVSATPSATADGYYWSVGTLAPGKSFSATIMTKGNAGSGENQINNEACATADNGKDTCVDNLLFIGTGAQIIAAAPAASKPSPVSGGVWGSAFDKKEFGTWVWDYPDQITQAYAQGLVTAAAQNGFNAIYLTIDDYLPIAALPAGVDKTAKTKAYMASVAAFVAAAKAKSIAVDLECGAHDWGESANEWKGFALIDFVDQYNAAYPSAGVRGLQYDVESYLYPGYASNQAGVLLDFANFIDVSAARMRAENPQLRFSVVVPHFYDSQIGWTSQIVYKGKSEYTLTALLQALQVNPNSYLIVMAYRNFVSGDNSTEALAQAEVQEASSNGYTTKVIVAQETGNVQPAYVTFYGLSKQDLYDALTKVEGDFGSYSSFAGVAVHYLDPFLKLQ